MALGHNLMGVNDSIMIDRAMLRGFYSSFQQFYFVGVYEDTKFDV